jgi:hypothetical protein
MIGGCSRRWVWTLGGKLLVDAGGGRYTSRVRRPFQIQSGKLRETTDLPCDHANRRHLELLSIVLGMVLTGCKTRRPREIMTDPALVYERGTKR